MTRIAGVVVKNEIVLIVLPVLETDGSGSMPSQFQGH